MTTSTNSSPNNTSRTLRRGKGPAPAKRSAAAKAEKKTNRGPDKTKPVARKESKLQKCLTLLRSVDGATIEELIAATGWQAHSVRGFLAGTVKKKLNLALASSKAADGERRYRIARDGV
jgi:hypothetical protein